MKIRNKLTGQVHEVMEGTLFPSFFERVTDDEIKVGEPKVEFEIEQAKEPATEPKATKKSTKTAKKTKKGARKDGNRTTK